MAASNYYHQAGARILEKRLSSGSGKLYNVLLIAAIAAIAYWLIKPDRGASILNGDDHSGSYSSNQALQERFPAEGVMLENNNTNNSINNNRQNLYPNGSIQDRFPAEGVELEN